VFDFESVAVVVAHLLIGFGFLGGSSLFGARTPKKSLGPAQLNPKGVRACFRVTP
jgi:hypothetical protein